MDLVAYILMNQVVAHQQRKLQQICNGREKLDWIKDFKSEWKKLSKRPINNVYVTDIENWICGCPYYLTDRFRLCKHLIQQKGIVSDEFFANIRRNYKPPFLIENNLLSYTDNNKENYHKDLNITDESTEGDMELFDDLIDTTEKALTLLKEQKSAGNIKWCKSAMKSFNGIIKLVKEVEQYQRKRTMPLTWKVKFSFLPFKTFPFSSFPFPSRTFPSSSPILSFHFSLSFVFRISLDAEFVGSKARFQ
ncbi:ATP-dependent DNA helicase Pif1 [Rhizophagus clarus]|uniref:ATP-dependent DNA helicase Pif1 n=1 Tax=Rhizophagus clarus TaxID=94130 RepID=A0A8H3M1K1_9GLOM|nr:ATP-dependent DNA helicase Pif1 [Rhizophagus clarus]